MCVVGYKAYKAVGHQFLHETAFRFRPYRGVSKSRDINEIWKIIAPNPLPVHMHEDRSIAGTLRVWAMQPVSPPRECESSLLASSLSRKGCRSTYYVKEAVSADDRCLRRVSTCDFDRSSLWCFHLFDIVVTAGSTREPFPVLVESAWMSALLLWFTTHLWSSSTEYGTRLHGHPLNLCGEMLVLVLFMQYGLVMFVEFVYWWDSTVMSKFYVGTHKNDRRAWF